MSRSGCAILVAILASVCVPSIAQAQSAIAGVVKDASGAVLPGVTVDASSPALIEKSRAVATDGNGQYKIVDLRPGTYTVTFTLGGFQTIRREGLELPSEFTATVNADMKVGAIEETVTVSGAAPTVDVQSAAHVQVLDREAIDNLPTGRTIQGIGQIVVGINLSLPDVGGSRAAMQTYMSVHGLNASNNTVMIDGMMVNGLEANGAVQSYFNDAMSQEMSYQTSGIGADVSSGGVRLNLIPKDGGNRFSGSAGYANRPGRLQGDNLTPRLQAAGLTAGNSTEYISDFTAAEGGPVVKDRVWFFATARDYRTSNRISNTFFDGGAQGDDYNYIRDGLGRVTWQVSSRNKISGYYDRISKYRAHDMQSLYDPETASNVWTSPNYSTGSIKWTSTVTNRLLLEAGYAFNVEKRDVDMQPGVEKDRGTADWFAGASRTQAGVTLGARATAPSTAGQEYPTRYSYNVALSYVTGSHHVKFGANGTGGDFFHSTRANADLTEQFTNANTAAYINGGGPVAFSAPVSVVVRNTPVQSEERLNWDLGVFGMDTWTMRRLTVNAGLRWEYLNSQVVAQTSPAGRFVPARSAPENLNLPSWKDFAPRFQAVYDITGSGKTAVKFSLNRYNQAQTTSLAAGFNPLASKTATIPWTDLNGDGIAQGQRTWNADGSKTDCVYLTPGCEINLAQLAANFGLLSDAGTYGGYPRSWNLESGLELQHELFPRVSVSGAWFYGNFHNLTSTMNRNLSAADYTPVQIFNPQDGTPITIYNISAAAQGRATDNFTFVDPDRRDVFSSYEFQARARAGAGVLIFGGVSIERELLKNCTIAQTDPNLNRFCDQFNLPEGQNIPYTANWRLNASYPLPWLGITVSGTFQSNDGGARAESYQILRTTRYPDGSATYLAAGAPVPGCPSPCTPGGLVAPNLTLTTFNTTTIGSTAYTLLPLYPTGSQRYERLNQLDLKIAKSFKTRGVTISPTLELFNLNNSDKVITVASTSYALSGGAYLRPNSIVQGRIIGLAVQSRW
jgi:Carboxypeptidase regulatory-like domain